MTSISVFLGKRIKEIREAKNIKQTELADMIDMEPTNLSKIEKGVHMPKDDTVEKIIKALNVNIDTLLSFEFKDKSETKTKEQLLCCITEILNNSDIKDIKFFYRVLASYNDATGKSI